MPYDKLPPGFPEPTAAETITGASAGMPTITGASTRKTILGGSAPPAALSGSTDEDWIVNNVDGAVVPPVDPHEK